MGGNEASAADEERVDKFLERALSESRRWINNSTHILISVVKYLFNSNDSNNIEC